VTAVVQQRTSLERAVIRDRWLVLGSLLIVAGACWAWIVPMAQDMYGDMSGLSAWMMSPAWTGTHVALLFAMWTAMMIGMMLPSAAPTLLIYGMVTRRSDAAADAALRVHIFAGGYVVVWTAFSAAATLAQRAFTAADVLTPMMEARAPLAGGAMLLVAGLYQLTPLKRACLQACQSPVTFLTKHWRAGRAGAFRIGLVHGWYCLGCCWALMLLLFAGGVMNLAVIAGLTIFLLIEKLMPPVLQGGRFSGVVLSVAGLYMIASPYLNPAYLHSLTP
jgi:predicted metal-binding membrane protein